MWGTRSIPGRDRWQICRGVCSGCEGEVVGYWRDVGGVLWFVGRLFGFDVLGWMSGLAGCLELLRSF